MIIVYIGMRGSGKTLTMTIDAFKKYKEGYKIYSNYHLNFPHTRYTVDDLLMFAESGMVFQDTLFLVDEAHILFDSYSRGKRSIIFSYLLNQSSKMNCDFYFSTQFSRQIFIRIRLNTEIVVESVARVILWKTPTSKPVMIENYRKKPKDYHTEVYIYNRMIKFSDTGEDKIIKRMYKANKYFPLYDTREVIKQEIDMFQKAKMDNPKLNKDVKKVKKLTYKETRERQQLKHKLSDEMQKGFKKEYGEAII